MTEKEKQTTIASASLELLISIVGLIIAIIFAVIALGLTIWAMQVFGIAGDVARAAALTAVAIIIGPTIAAFATKRYF